MFKKYGAGFVLFVILIALCTGKVYSQKAKDITGPAKAAKTEWKTDPFDHRVFIQNNGQFDGKIPGNDKVLYCAQLGQVWAYFTNKGIVYSRTVMPKQKDKDADPDAKPIHGVTYYMNSAWLGSDVSAVISAENELSYYYTYPIGNDGTIRANIFRKITYKNLYPGIDVEYYFPQGKDGIEYSVIVHPGADISVVKLNYSGAKNLKLNPNREITFTGKLGDFTDHAPYSYYQDGGDVPVAFHINGSTESFTAGQYDKGKTLIIDPWQTNPAFSNIDKAYIMDWDNKGNVYAYGGDPLTLLQLVKIDKTGVIQWTYNATSISGSTPPSTYNDLGFMCTDKVTGTSYLGQGLGLSGTKAVKVNTLGNHVGTLNSNNDMWEFWIARFDQCHSKVIIGGGGLNTAGNQEAAVLDTDMTTFTPVEIYGTTETSHDIAQLALDPSGDSCYMANAKSSGHPTTFNNDVMQLPLPTLSPTAYIVNDKNRFAETHSVYYAGFVGQTAGGTNAMNGAAASPNWLYLYNADTVQRINKNTGAVNSIFPIRNSQAHFRYLAPFIDTAWEVMFGGIDVDQCDHLFVGVVDSMYAFNSNFTVNSKILLPDTVYDIRVGFDSVIYACGRGYVTQVKNPFPRYVSFAITNPTDCSSCNGISVATLNGACPLKPVSYYWSTGATTSSVSGLCYGNYWVAITDSSTCPPHVDSGYFTLGGAGFTATVIDTNPTCSRTGNITAYPTPTVGFAPFTYIWNNGGTTQEITNLAPGTYTCLISSVPTSCSYFFTVTLVLQNNLTVNTSPSGKDSVCLGQGVRITASGGTSYTWAPATGLSCTNCSNPLASPSVTTTYTVTGSNISGCSGTDTINIKVDNGPPISITPPFDTICKGGSTVLTGNGALSYAWIPSTGLSCTNCASPTANPTSPTSYSVVGTDAMGCKDTAKINLDVLFFPVGITPVSSTVCFGDSVTLTANGTGPYKWSNNSTNSSITVSPAQLTTYTVVTTNRCPDSATASVGVDVPSLSVCCNDSIAAGDTVHLDASGVSSYVWIPAATLTCSTCDNPIASPTVTTTYTITGTDANGCSADRTLTVRIETPCADFKVPNTFTPNNDGINDDFVINIQDITSYNITIYDRWGKQVFTSSDPNTYWNGRINSTENLAPDGTYYYIIKANCGSNNYDKKGFVQVVGEK